jgi:hypothetical protein
MQTSQALVQVQYAPATSDVTNLSGVPGFHPSAVGLEIEAWVPFEHWDRYGQVLVNVERSIHWQIGDWLRFGERTYGEMYTQAQAITGYANGTLRNLVFVAEKFEPSRRRDNLPFDVFATVASLPADEQEQILDEAEATDASIREVRQLVKIRKAEKQAKQSGKFFDANIEQAKLYWERLRPQIEEFQQLFPPAALHVPTFLDDVNEALDMSFNDPPQFILEALEQQPRTTQELLKATGYCDDTLDALLNELATAGRIEKRSQGKITDMARGAVQTVWACVEG